MEQHPIYSTNLLFRGWQIVQCYRIDRGKDLSPVQSCDGPGDIAVFYTNGVWFCAALTLAFLFLQGGLAGFDRRDGNAAG